MKAADLTEADAMAYFSNCLAVTAMLAREFDINDREFHDTLRALQLQFDIRHRKLIRQGVEQHIVWPSVPEKLREFDSRMTPIPH